MLRRRDATEAAGNELGSIRGTVTVDPLRLSPYPTPVSAPMAAAKLRTTLPVSRKGRPLLDLWPDPPVASHAAARFHSFRSPLPAST